MNAAFARLSAAVPPPQAPVEAGTRERFAAVEASLALSLPEDYKLLVTAYGSGSWKSFLWVLNPFSSNRYLNLMEQVPLQLEAERMIRASGPKEMPFALHPEAGGLFPWAITDNGDRLYWLTEGDPNRWPSIIYESRGPRYDRHDLCCSELLRGWIVGELRVSVFPDDFEHGFAGAFTAV